MNDRFYNGRTWRRVSKAFMQSKHYICERCGGAGEVAHHKVYLDRWNVNDPEIAFNWENLECLCLACHNAEHGGGSSATAAGVVFDDLGNVICPERGRQDEMTANPAARSGCNVTLPPYSPPKNDRD